MTKNLGAELKNDLKALNSYLSKVKVKVEDIPLQVKTQYGQKLMKNASKDQSSVSLANPKDIRQPIRKILSEQRARKILTNPISSYDIDMVKKKFNIPSSVVQNTRQLGKTKYSKPKSLKNTKASVLPKQFRDNPLAEPPPITEKDVSSGILSLIHRGLIPKDVDLTPAFERGLPPLQMKVAQFHDWRDMAPPPPLALTTDPILPLERLALPETSHSQPIMNFDSKALVPVFEEIKTYEQIVDCFSSHQIIFRKGKIMNTPEFQSFKRINSEHWGAIAQNLAYAEETFFKLATPLVYLDGKKFINIIKDELRPIKFEQLLSCIMNSSTILPIILNPIHKFKSPLGKDLAAVKIQAAWRCHKTFIAYKQLRIMIKKSVIIQNCIRNWKRKTKTRLLIKQKTLETLKTHQLIQQQFEAEYESYKNSSRVEIHIFNTEEDLNSIITPDVLQSSQINRVFSIKNPLINVIIITSKVLSDEIKNYYYRVLEIGGINDPQARVMFIAPDILNKQSLILRTSGLLYFSSKTLQLIKNLTKDKKAYIVPGKINLFDILVSVRLNVPIFSGTYTETNKYSSKSEVKKIFQDCELPIPFSEANITSEKLLYQKLALLIVQYSEVETWILKMNREEGSRGLAYFEVSNLKIMGEIRKSYDLKQACELQDVISELKTSLSTIIKFVMPSLYKDWSQYLQKFTKHGGIIQATPIEDKAYITFPSVSFMIEPDGQVNYITSSDSLHSCNYLNAAGFFPQLSLSQEDVINILKTLSKSLYSKKLYGHFTVQFAAFADRYKESLKPIPWAVDLSFGMNRMVPVYYYFHFLMGGTLDITTGKYFAQNTEEEIENEDNNKLGDGNIYHLKNSPRKHMTNELYAKLPNKYEGDCPIFKDFNLYDTREFIFSWEMWHPSLAALDLKTFFHMCRYEGISYDLEQGQGTVFIIYDLLKYGYIGCMCISSKREFLLKSINHVFTFLLQHTGPPPQVVDDYNGKEYRPFSELIAKIRLVEKRSKKTKSKKRIIDQILQD